jgi:hypothetical protein
MEAGTLTSEWADWNDANIPDMDAVAERQQFEGYVCALWNDLKTWIVTSIAEVNKHLDGDGQIDCADSPGGGLALTRWSEYPVALLDVSIDVEAATLECVYSCAAREGDQYRELRKLWSIKNGDGGLLVTDDESGEDAASPDDIARVIVEAYLANL